MRQLKQIMTPTFLELELYLVAFQRTEAKSFASYSALIGLLLQRTVQVRPMLEDVAGS